MSNSKRLLASFAHRNTNKRSKYDTRSTPYAESAPAPDWLRDQDAIDFLNQHQLIMLTETDASRVNVPPSIAKHLIRYPQPAFLKLLADTTSQTHDGTYELPDALLTKWYATLTSLIDTINHDHKLVHDPLIGAPDQTHSTWLVKTLANHPYLISYALLTQDALRDLRNHKWANHILLTPSLLTHIGMNDVRTGISQSVSYPLYPPKFDHIWSKLLKPSKLHSHYKTFRGINSPREPTENFLITNQRNIALHRCLSLITTELHNHTGNLLPDFDSSAFPTNSLHPPLEDHEVDGQQHN